MSMEPKRAHHLGKYELQTRLGRGGMAEVWKAFDPQLRRHVAIKLMLTELKQDADFLVRFEREARLVASLDHPNIVRIHDFHISQPPESETPTPYMVMDYVKGQTLADYIGITSRRGTIPSWSDIVYLFAITSRALDYAHQKGMVHRDIKPANILLDQRIPTSYAMGVPILTDFGVARMQGTQTGTLRGSLIGTPSYIAPEQALGQHGDRRSDLYSLGIILYEITTGVTPFRAETTIAVIMQHIHGTPTSPALINPHIPPAVSQIILKSIAKKPEERFFSATDMTMALAQALNIPLPGRGSSAGYTPLPPSASSPLTPPDLSGPEAFPGMGNTTVNTQDQRYREPTTPPYLLPEAQPLQVPRSTYTPYFGFVPVGSEQQHQLPNPEKQPSRGKLTVIGRRTVIFSIIVLILLIAGGLGIAVLQANNPPSVHTIAVSGHVMFFRSLHAAAGNYDQIQVDINNVPPPPQGDLYYAWIVGNTLENSPPHWRLAYDNGALHLGRQSYLSYANLLKPGALFLVTEEDAASSPTVPFTDPHARLYYAQIANASLTRFTIESCPMVSTANICMS